LTAAAMRRPWPLRGAVAAVAIALLAGAGCGGPSDPSARSGGDDAAPVLAMAPAQRTPRNLILVTLDTTRRDRIGCYPDAVLSTPVLQDLCTRGVALGQAMAVAPVTLPAHASILTGLYPPNHGARYNGERRLVDRHETLAEILADAGFATAAFVSAFVLDRRFGTAQGFGHYDDDVAESPGALAGSGNERDAEATVSAALAFVRGRSDARPLFLWIHLFDPHGPYLRRGLAADASDAERYDAEILHVDGQLGRLLSAPELDASQSVVMVLADHGEAMGMHGERYHGLFVYDSTIAIPWIVAAPGLTDGGSAASALVSQVDLLPTVLELLGLPVPDGLDGRSLLAPARPARAAVYMEATLPYFDFRLAPLHALRTATGKRIEAPRPEYYRLDLDPAESRNLLELGETDDQADRLAVELDALLAQWPAVAAADGSEADPSGGVAERLRALGYLSGTDLGLDSRDPKDAVELVVIQQSAAEAEAAGDVDKALALLDQAEATMPGLRKVLYMRARLRALSGDLAGAERDILEVNAGHANADSLLLLAQLCILDGRLDQAAPLLDEAARLDPGHGGVLVARGDIALARGDRASAGQAYRQALELDAGRVGVQARSRLAALTRR
jgi:choline-sulfatase